MSELFLDDIGLIAQQTWVDTIHSLESSLSKKPKQELIEQLAKDITRAVEKRIQPNTALLFSGGIDSTLIAFLLKKLGVEFTCITIGYQAGNERDPEDIVESVKVARELGLKQEVVLLNQDDMESLFQKTATILGPLTTVVSIGVGSVEVAGFEKGKQLGLTHFFGGLGSEEIFAGYERHEKALENGESTLHEECVSGLIAMHERDLERDCKIATSCNITVATPFLDKEVIKTALTVPPTFLIDKNKTFQGKAQGNTPLQKPYKKLILREVAIHLGLPEHLAYRPKRAAQYGSRTNNALTKIAKKNGFKNKDAYLQSLAPRAA